jgi:hypothetical protein
MLPQARSQWVEIRVARHDALCEIRRPAARCMIAFCWRRRAMSGRVGAPWRSQQSSDHARRPSVAASACSARCPFGSAGTLRWWNAWVFLAVGIAAIATRWRPFSALAGSSKAHDGAKKAKARTASLCRSWPWSCPISLSSSRVSPALQLSAATGDLDLARRPRAARANGLTLTGDGQNHFSRATCAFRIAATPSLAAPCYVRHPLHGSHPLRLSSPILSGRVSPSGLAS